MYEEEKQTNKNRLNELKSAKNRFKLSAGLNLEKSNTILGETKYI